MGWMRRRRFSGSGTGEFVVRLPPAERDILAALPDQLAALVADGPSPVTVRLFPPAYGGDEELDAEFQRLMGDELVRRRTEAAELVRDTITKERLTEAELSAWVGVFNDVRLVLGTALDVSEQSDVLDVDPEAEDLPLRVTYVLLSEIVFDAVQALSGALPPPSRE